MPVSTPQVFTLGHSTRTWDEFLALLESYEIGRLVDVRTAPRSRRMPHFDREVMKPALGDSGIGYLHIKDLGGWRRPVSGSPNGGWRSKSFQGYADHMATPAFEQALARLTTVAKSGPTAMMCAEALPWRCHRMLISDALHARGWKVLHIGAGASAEPHRLTAFAVVDGEHVTYPPSQTALRLLPEE
jgi:uncharacterized protein (DUF488 family)